MFSCDALLYLYDSSMMPMEFAKSNCEEVTSYPINKLLHAPWKSTYPNTKYLLLLKGQT